MRRNLRILSVLVLTGALVALLATPASAQRRLPMKPDLVVSSSSEPPDFIATESGGDFIISFTVDNQGRRRVRPVTIARAYLSLGRVMSADDRRRRVGSRRIQPLRTHRSTTRRMVVRVPREFQQGEFFLIVCADVRRQVDEINDRANCHVSGQKLRIAPEAARRGPAGPPGPAGPAGPQGPKGDPADVGFTVTDIERRTLTAGTNTMDAGEDDPNDSADSGDEIEGSTQEVDLGTFGPFTFRALCRNKGSDGDTQDEGKILVYVSQGTFSFESNMGPRYNIPAGRGTVDDDTPAGGEGKHQILTASRDLSRPDPGNPGAFTAFTTVLTHSNGTLLTFTGYAGIDTLGFGTAGDDATGSPTVATDADVCVFGGSVTTYQ